MTPPSDGIEINRGETKSELMRYVNADGSERVETGAYLIRPSHNPRTRQEDLDSDAFDTFKRTARRVYDQ